MSRIVVITGASRGLGFELAKRFINEGDTVYGISRTRKHWDEARSGLPSPAFQLIRCDITSQRSVPSVLQKIHKTHKRIDILVNNAGYCGRLVRVEDTPVHELEKHLRQNLVSAFLMCKYAIPFMRTSGQPLIINVSSMAGTRAVPRLFPYSASKFGVLALSQAIAKENDGTALKCVTVCPGGMNTRMRLDLFGKEDAERQQGADFVADVIDRVVQGKIDVLSGGHIVIRHGRITGIYPPPAA
ncbi:MAG: 2-(R)-hydroxypropyl-CoM dehydrogenase [Candidatus Omnitrophica bacterium ADurb.Bin314]|jgi:NAD(P)-dependent dehydrogenase (short-subunit alcohol dehydrogenase family)|nr:MAG: 2-(R)-hydroxypropyl-CoM dehydrogenase [Candidatus Omnitrophica bacterium ADurb.Bin314]HOE69254.1 SDR family oxidoreductase [Candidatus Omnitrophota bacterium]